MHVQWLSFSAFESIQHVPHDTSEQFFVVLHSSDASAFVPWSATLGVLDRIFNAIQWQDIPLAMSPVVCIISMSIVRVEYGQTPYMDLSVNLSG